MFNDRSTIPMALSIKYQRFSSVIVVLSDEAVKSLPNATLYLRSSGVSGQPNPGKYRLCHSGLLLSEVGLSK